MIARGRALKPTLLAFAGIDVVVNDDLQPHGEACDLPATVETGRYWVIFFWQGYMDRIFTVKWAKIHGRKSYPCPTTPL